MVALQVARRPTKPPVVDLAQNPACAGSLVTQKVCAECIEGKCLRECGEMNGVRFHFGGSNVLAMARYRVL